MHSIRKKEGNQGWYKGNMTTEVTVPETDNQRDYYNKDNKIFPTSPLNNYFWQNFGVRMHCLTYYFSLYDW